MFFSLSKVLDLLVAPLTWALLLGLLALLLQRGRPRRAALLLALALVLLSAFSLEPVSRRLFARLEARAADTFRPDPPYDVAVVLGGVLDPSASQQGELELNEAAERLVRAAALLRAGQAKVVLLSAGNAFPHPGEPTEAELMAGWLRQEGVAADRIFLEDQSRNTRENALFSAPIITAHGWKRVLLVTSAWHAPRALGCFRAVGLEPDLLPVDHRAAGRYDLTGPRAAWGPRQTWFPRAAALSASTDALRELLGGLVYRAMGYTR